MLIPNVISVLFIPSQSTKPIKDYTAITNNNAKV